MSQRKARVSVSAPRVRRPAAARAAAELATEVAAVAAYCHAQGWCRATSGNFSAVLRREPLELLITPSGVDKGRLLPGDLVTIGADGRPVGGRGDDRGKPSAEAALHGAIAQTVGVGAVVHTHSVAGTLLGERFLPQGGFRIRGYEMLKGLRGVRSHEAEVPVPVLANSQDMGELAARVRALLSGTPDLHGFLLSGHGLYTWGEDLAEARRHVETFEFLFEVVARRTLFSPFSGG